MAADAQLTFELALQEEVAGARAPELTAEQEQAVERRDEPLLLSAGAGSGKTSVLVERFVRAVLEDGLAPAQVLAITFTERAAGELLERVRARFLALGRREEARDTEAAFVGTFHGFCARVLRAHALAAGLDPRFEILEEGLAGRLRERAFSVALTGFLEGERREAVDLLAAYGVDRIRAIVASVHGELRSRGERFPSLPVPSAPAAPPQPAAPGAPDPPAALGDSEPLDERAAAACALIDELLGRFSAAYEALKRERGTLDFDDLELLALELLRERTEVRRSWSARFELLMVDEFQDTNPRQLEILRALDRGNLFTVGDALQAIYGFRHADVALFRARRAELAQEGRSLLLTRNFRGAPPLLEVVNAAFAERFGEAFAALDPGRGGGGPAQEEPRVELLLTDRRGWERDELAERLSAGLPPAPLWRQAEARALAGRIAELVREGGARAGEIVLLLRAVGDVEVYERALQLQGLRTLATVGGFWDGQQVGDLLAYLRALANPLDELALYETLASPLVGLSSDGLALLAQSARARGRGVWEALSTPEGIAALPEHDRRRALAFAEFLSRERRAAARRTLAQLIERALDGSGYREHVLAQEWGERRLANVHKLLRLARRFQASEGRDLRGFLDHVAHLREAAGGSEPDAPVQGAEPDAVRIMTVHAAKGLEFDVVCVADLGRAPNLAVPDLIVEGERVGLRLVRLEEAESTPTLEFAALCEERRARQLEEEDRILYVAMTRARERLLLSGAVDFARWPKPAPTAPPLAWLGPALAPALPQLLAEPPGESFDLAVGELATPVRCRLNRAGAAELPLPPEPALPSERALPPERALPSERAQGSATEVRRPDEARADRLRPGSPGLDRLRPGSPGLDPLRPGSPGSVAGAPPVPPSLSYTSLSEFERCGYRYYLERVLRLPEDRAAARAEGHGLEARARGTLVHRLLETLDFARPCPPEPQAVRACARSLGIRVDAEEAQEISDLLAAACRAPLAGRVGEAREVRREHPFALALPGERPLLGGVIDLLARERDGGALVLDYKSDRLEEGVELEALVEREYAVQRMLYALAVLRDGALVVEVVHWFLERPHEWASARFTATHRPELEARLAERVRAARGGPFAPSERPHRALCLTCPGRRALCSWGETETMREHPLQPGL